ncbi:MAG: T9SS type A sorting domain-containing protein [Bacteroidota bacterium]
MRKNYIFLLLLLPIAAMSQSFQLVKDVNPTTSGLSLNCSFREMNGKLYYLFTDQATGNTTLNVSDGTSAGTYKITQDNVSVSSPIIIGGNKIFFFATDGINGKEPWISDGTTLGTHMIKNINLSTNDFDFNTFFASFLSADANKAFFIGNDGTNGDELWVTDGTEAGTILTKDIYAGATGSQIKVSDSMGSNMKDGKLYFFAVNGTGGFTINGEEPWVSDGTPAGTFMLKDIKTGFNPSSGSANTKHFVEYNGKMYFFANGDTAALTGLYETDGTTIGTQIVYSTSIYRIDEFLIRNNLIYFTHSNGPALYSSDGTTAGTNLVATIPDGQLNNLGTCQMVDVNGTLFLRAVSNTVGAELFKLDNSSQIVNVKDIKIGSPSGVTGNIFPNRKVLQVYGGKVWFLASDGSLSGALEMWNSDGTLAGTTALSPLNGDGGFAGGNGNHYNIFATSFGMFMIYYNAAVGAELYLYTSAPLSNPELENNYGISLYPNPSKGEFTIQVSNIFVGGKATIYNLLGQAVKEFNIDENEEQTNLNPGVYLVNVQKENKTITKKIVVQ